jgi:hypothetical protein
VIGLFKGMFEKNMLTFNPGWDSNAQPLASFTDVRELQRQLKAQGVQLVNEADETTTGPGSFIAVDPKDRSTSTVYAMPENGGPWVAVTSARPYCLSGTGWESPSTSPRSMWIGFWSFSATMAAVATARIRGLATMRLMGTQARHAAAAWA